MGSLVRIDRMKKQNNQTDQTKIDIATEQLARLFIEQAKYQQIKRGNKRIIEETTYTEKLKLVFSFRWTPVFSNEGEEYRFPNKTTSYMRSKYKCPAIYRWNFYQDQPEDKKLFYIGETEFFCRRIGHYRTPDGSQQTNKRIRERIDKYLADGLKIKLEVLRLVEFQLGKTTYTQSELVNKHLRQCIEELLVTFYQNKGYILLNL